MGPMGGFADRSPSVQKPPANTGRQRLAGTLLHDKERALTLLETLALRDEHGVSVARTCCMAQGSTGNHLVIGGARTEEHLRDNLAATELKLTEEQSLRIEAVTRRQPLYPYWHRFTAGIDRFDPAEQPFLAEHQKTLDARTDK